MSASSRSLSFVSILFKSLANKPSYKVCLRFFAKMPLSVGDVALEFAFEFIVDLADLNVVLLLDDG